VVTRTQRLRQMAATRIFSSVVRARSFARPAPQRPGVDELPVCGRQPSAFSYRPES
jgi:hypothetical protein